MQKYGIGGGAVVGITPMVTAQVPNSQLAAALMLAEVLQHTGKLSEAAEVLESLGSIVPDPLFGLSLADLYMELGRWDDVLRVTADFRENVDDATAQIQVFRARALRENGLNDAALEVLKEALKSKKREEGILAEARYERALAYEALGQRGRARQEWERLYAMDPAFRDVGDRVASFSS
jgi:tetratricopeptide (TPR) repeat protein